MRNNKIVLFCLNMMVFAITLLISLVYQFGFQANSDWSVLILCVALITFIFQLFGLIVNGYDMFTFQFWYVCFTNLFMFGHVVLLALRQEEYIVWDLYKTFSYNLLLNAGFCVLIFLQACYLGMTFPCHKSKSLFYRGIADYNEQDNTRVFTAGIIGMILTLPFRVYTDYSLIKSIGITNNYFKSAVLSGIQDDIAMLFVPSVIFVIASKKLKKLSCLVLLGGVCIYFVLIMIMTGDRRFPVTAILALLICYFKTFDSKIKVKSLAIVGVVGVIGLNTLAIIRDIRKGHLLGVKDFFSVYGNALFSVKDAFFETLGEFGISFYSVVQILKNIPSRIGFQLGKGFWGAIPSILPVGRIMGGFFFEVTISSYINTMEGNPVGETIIGEFWANYGILFPIIAFLFGMFISHFFSFDSIENKQLSIAKYYSFFYIEVNLVRTCFFEVFRPSCYIYIFFLILLKCNFKLGRRERHYGFKS